MKQQKKLWIFLVIISCNLWGISGLCAKRVFDLSTQVSPITITQIRMLISGLFLLLLAQLTGKKPIKILYSRKNIIDIILYGLFGLIPIQLFYFIVVQKSNASIATILQFMGPFFIMFYMVAFEHQFLRRLDIVAALVAFMGIIFIATHGNFSKISLSPEVLFWGFLSALGVATNTLIPRPLLKRMDSVTLIAWSMIATGLMMLIAYPSQILIPKDSRVIILLVVIIILGTILPFYCMLNSLRYIKPSTASILDAFEPISATLGSVFVFNLILKPIDWLGTILVILAVIAICYQPKSKIKSIQK
ncbi:EamA family transporter [Lactobacillus iners]|uniref:DMT family transporter n=1 Tax=Lactobacillus iners TaxID=147802 RepID=UPI0013E1D3CF|nr:DMT family transporter [Lactobacillus iners]MDK7883229.1 DMT family transporter [Lactobacillus iners]QIH24590.1 EamA family transporter [Lactobacillus iners]